MAEDLIPPPSPAGRPDPDAGRAAAAAREELRETPWSEAEDDRPGLATHADDAEPSAAERDAASGAEKTAAPVESPYRARFGFITGALIGLAMAAIAIAILTAGGGRTTAGTDGWSDWRPTAADGYAAATQIAERVGRQYRLNGGTQLVGVQAGPIQIDDVPLTVVLRAAGPKGNVVKVPGDSLWYVLNGFGERGSLDREKPSTQRLALLKREGLELALYTFRYVDDVDNVVIVLPPPPPGAAAAAIEAAAREAAKGKRKGAGKGAGAAAQPAGAPSPAPAAPADAEQPLNVLLFRREEMAAQLRVPLALTVPPNPPPPKKVTKEEESVLTEFTAPINYNAVIRQAQDGSGFLVLERPVPAAQPQLQASPPGGDE